MRLAGALQGTVPRGLDPAIRAALDCRRGEGVGGSAVLGCGVLLPLGV